MLTLERHRAWGMELVAPRPMLTKDIIYKKDINTRYE